MPTLTEIMAEVGTLFTSLGLMPLIAASFIVGGVGLLARRVIRAVR